MTLCLPHVVVAHATRSISGRALLRLAERWRAEATGPPEFGQSAPANSSIPEAGNIPLTDKPVVGDWDGNGTDTIGVVRNDNGGARWMLSNNNAAVNYDFGWGTAYQAPLSGDWCVASLGCTSPDGVDTPAMVG